MSFISTYQGRKSLFAEKLISKGVSASGTDGLTTLINKIDDIQHFDSGLTLYADKSIAQSSDTVNLYALLLNNGKPVSGESVAFCLDTLHATANSTSGTAQNITLDNDCWSISSDSLGMKIRFGSSSSYFDFVKASEGWNIYYNGGTPPSILAGDIITYLGEGILYDELGNSLDLSTVSGSSSSIVSNWLDNKIILYAMNFNGYTGYATIDVLSGTATTSSNGVATFQYTCTGAGKINFSAKSGGIQSEPYTVTDCVLIDTDGTNWTSNSPSTTSVSTETNGVKFGNTGSSTVFINLNYPGSSHSGLEYEWTGDYCFEFNMPTSNTKTDVGMQVVGASGGTGTAFSKTFTELSIVDGSKVKVTVINGNVTVYVDNNTPIATTNNINNAYRISFYLVASKYIILDNFRIYPI